MEISLLNGSMIAIQDEKTGQWIYKANESNQFKPFKKNGNLKSVYRDLPRFKAIVQYEQKELDDFSELLAQSVKDISLRLLSFSK